MENLDFSGFGDGSNVCFNCGADFVLDEGQELKPGELVSLSCPDCGGRCATARVIETSSFTCPLCGRIKVVAGEVHALTAFCPCQDKDLDEYGVTDAMIEANFEFYALEFKRA